MWYDLNLFSDPAVQKDLHLSLDTVGTVLTLMAQETAKFAPPDNSAAISKAPSMQQMNAMADAYNRMVGDCVNHLAPAQRLRLHQITLQSLGASALFDSKIAAEVGLSRSQISALNKYAATHSIGALTDPSRDDAAAQQKRRRESDTTLKAVLTPNQLLKWKVLEGSPVKLTPMSKLGEATVPP